jgi:hypothetical protein
VFSADPRWLFGARVDLVVFGGSALASLGLLVLGAQLGMLHGDAPPWLWLVGVVLIDVAHVWTTTLRVYLDKREVMHRPALYFGLPIACYVLGLFAHAVSSRVFWTLLAYTAVFHFVRQQWGWVALFHRRNPQTSRADRVLDSAAIYSATLYPLAYWHAHLPRRFHWLIEGDFLFIPPLSPSFVASLEPAYLVLLALFCARQAQLWLRGALIPGKALIVLSTFACWYFGIVAFDSDYAFTATNVLIHGVPYFALTYRYARGRVAQSEPAPTLARVLKLGAAGVVALFGLVALGEELLWERWVWSDHPLGQLALVFVVPLLALPQATHYALDGWIWKRTALAHHGTTQSR